MKETSNTRACVLFALIFAACYGGAAWWTSTLPGPLPSWDFAFEQRVPFVPSLSIIYLTITPVLLLAPFLLRDRTPMFAYALSVQTIIAALFFLLFPQANAWTRPDVTGWPRIPFGIADAMNLAYNEFPSLHVAFAVSAARAYRRFAWTLWAAAVAVSAWLMWEHHLVEIVGGVALAMIVMPVAERESTWVELCCLAQCARFSRRHIRYFVIFLAIYGPSLLHWRRYRAVRIGFCAAQWIDDLLDGDRASEREPLEIIDELLRGTLSFHPLARLTRAFHAEVTPEARQEFIALVRCMRIDRVRVLGREVWSAQQLDEHHLRTFTLSVNLMLHTAGCTARAEQVPSLTHAFAWCSVFRDLDEDLRKGLNNIPRGVDVDEWTRESCARAHVMLAHSAVEIATLDDIRARKILGIFQRSIEKFEERRRPAGVLAAAPVGATTASTHLRMSQAQSTADLPPHLRPVEPTQTQAHPLPLEEVPAPPPSPAPNEDSRPNDPFLRRT
jgi:hypothetical protein